jgi:hypothetical protein
MNALFLLWGRLALYVVERTDYSFNGSRLYTLPPGSVKSWGIVDISLSNLAGSSQTTS